MRLNVFKIQPNELDDLKEKLAASGLTVIREVDLGGWRGAFYFSKQPTYSKVQWAEAFATFFDDMAMPTNRNYFAVFLLTKNASVYALSYGKSHFYLRPFCDYDFGIELAKRIANEADIKQTASRRFAGRLKKDIKSFTTDTQLDVASGESVEYLQAGIVKPLDKTFGATGQFGASAKLSPDITVDEVGAFLETIERQRSEPERFKLARTVLITAPEEIEHFDARLLKELRSDVGTTDFTRNSHDLYGVDFIFSSEGRFAIRSGRYPRLELEQLTMKDLKGYIAQHELSDEEILRIRIWHEPEDRAPYAEPLKETLDFIADDEPVVLDRGRWMRFNQDYLDALDEYLRTITVEEPEPQFREIVHREPTFNKLTELRDAGYELADKNFDIFKTRARTPIEAWDLKRGNRVYAVKFGTAQKLGYVCDQASGLLELLRNHAGVREIPDFTSYCLWLGYRGKTAAPKSIADTGSIILKQKIEAWARKARELNVEPVIKISRRSNPDVESATEGKE